MCRIRCWGLVRDRVYGLRVTGYGLRRRAPNNGHRVRVQCCGAGMTLMRGRTMMSTRRFWLRPSAVSLVTTG